MNDSILIIEDDEVISRFIHLALASNGFSPIEAKDGLSGIGVFLKERPSLVLLDLGLPDVDGLEVLAQIRSADQTVPVLIVSARGKEEEKVKALDQGADDYVTKPFSIKELLARIRALERRKGTPKSSVTFSFKNLSVDFAKHRLSVDGKEIHLTPIEFRLLSVLIENQGKVVTHRFLQEKAWGYDSTDDYQTLRVFVASIRHKIDPDGTQKYILTETGVGYRFDDADE